MIASGTAHLHQGQVVAHYRKALKWSQQDLADDLGVSLRTVQRLEQTPMIEDMKRRDFLVKLLGIPAALMALEHDVLFNEKKSNLILNDDPMGFLEDIVATRWKTHLMGGPLNAASGLNSVVREVEHFEQQVRGKAWHERALTQLSLIYQLQGSVAGDMMNYEHALEMYGLAFVSASELHDVELMAAVRVRQGIVLMRQNKPFEAVAYFNDGLDLIDGSGYPQLKGNTLTILSEAYAKAQQPLECWRTLDRAESVLEQQTPSRERSYRTFNSSLVTAHKGIDALLLRDFDRALRLIEKSIKTYDRTQIPTQARLLARKAEAYYGLHRIDECTDTAEEAFILAQSVGASNTLDRIKSLHATLQLSPWNREPGVRRLGALLASN